MSAAVTIRRISMPPDISTPPITRSFSPSSRMRTGDGVTPTSSGSILPSRSGFHVQNRSARKQLGDQLRFVYRNFPLTEIHPHALHTAFAAEAADAQGKFWEMHNYIFHHQHTLEDADLEQFAGAVGLDMQRFTQDMAQRPFARRIEEDFQSGLRSGVHGTPTFFINGVLYPGSWEQDALLAALKEA